MIQIKAEHIRSSEVVEMPFVVVTSPEFRRAYIAWLKLENGLEVEVVFDASGKPVTDPGLIRRLGFFFRKNFKAALFDGENAYAHRVKPDLN